MYCWAVMDFHELHAPFWLIGHTSKEYHHAEHDPNFQPSKLAATYSSMQDYFASWISSHALPRISAKFFSVGSSLLFFATVRVHSCWLAGEVKLKSAILKMLLVSLFSWNEEAEHILSALN